MAIERIFKAVLGLLLLLGAVWFGVWQWAAVKTLVLGAIPFVIALIGLVFVLLSFEK